MAEGVKQSCDVCAEPKKESNHWYRVSTAKSARLIIGKWEDGKFPKPHLHICGARCLSKVVSLFTEDKP